jgi:molecular chaperone IbpA
MCTPFSLFFRHEKLQSQRLYIEPPSVFRTKTAAYISWFRNQTHVQKFFTQLLTQKIGKPNYLLPKAHSGFGQSGGAGSLALSGVHIAHKEDMAMRTNFDFSPLFRSSIGFDRMIDLLESASRVDAADNFPPYDIAKLGEDDYRISMALAGFGQNEIDITLERNMLMVSGQKSGEESGQYLHHGIAGRSFQRRFELADHVKVAGAKLENGMLTIELKREIPEEMKPRRIEITGVGKGRATQIEAGKHAA